MYCAQFYFISAHLFFFFYYLKLFFCFFCFFLHCAAAVFLLLLSCYCYFVFSCCFGVAIALVLLICSCCCWVVLLLLLLCCCFAVVEVLFLGCVGSVGCGEKKLRLTLYINLSFWCSFLDKRTKIKSFYYVLMALTVYFTIFENAGPLRVASLYCARSKINAKYTEAIRKTS